MQKAFEEIANQEKEHAKRLFKFLEGGAVEITASYPAGVIGSTLDNLKAAAAGENEEYSDMYPSFADVAEAEGFPAIAAVMRNIAVAEKHHEARFLAFAAAIEAGRDFIMQSVLATSFARAAAPEGAVSQEWDLNGKKAVLSVRKA